MELNLCMRCMKELPDGGKICPRCGFDAEQEKPEPHHLPPGSVLAGKYMTGTVLGEGGFGVTYIGYDLNLGIRIAVKEYYPFGFVGRDSAQTVSVRSFSGQATDYFQKGKEKFLTEARGLAQFMKLPGIVVVRDFFLENNTAYIVMDYIEGPSLKEYARSLGGKIKAEELLRLMRPVIQSLIEVHGRGVIHRDISPDNILIDTEGTAWLIDFGAARDMSPEGERTLSVTLKKGYSPEEQYRTHGEQGSWTDVYAMCATLYAMMTGVKPDEPFDRMEEETLRPPRSLGADLTPQQEETLMKGLVIRAKNRLQTMEAVYNGLYSLDAGAVRDTGNATASGAGAGNVKKPRRADAPDPDSTPAPPPDEEAKREWWARAMQSVEASSQHRTDENRTPPEGSSRQAEEMSATAKVPPQQEKKTASPYWVLFFVASMLFCTYGMMLGIRDVWERFRVYGDYNMRDLRGEETVLFLILFVFLAILSISVFCSLDKKKIWATVLLYVAGMCGVVIYYANEAVSDRNVHYFNSRWFISQADVMLGVIVFFILVILMGRISRTGIHKERYLPATLLGVMAFASLAFFLVLAGEVNWFASDWQIIFLDPVLGGMENVFGEVMAYFGILCIALPLTIVVGGAAAARFFRRKVGVLPVPEQKENP